MGRHAISGILLVVAVVAIALAARTHQQNQVLQSELTKRGSLEAKVSKMSKPDLAPAVRPDDSAAPAAPPEAAVRTVADDGNWRQELANKDNLIAQLQAELEAAQAKPEPPREPPNRGRNWMQDLKESDPERYQQIQAARAEFSRRAQERMTKQDEFFKTLSVENMSAEQRTNHERVTQAIADIQRLSAEIEVAAANGDSSRELRQEMMETVREIRPLLEAERDYSLRELGASLGYEDDGAREFAEYVNYVYEMTSLSGMWGGGRGGWGGRGGRSSTGEAPGDNTGGDR